MNNQLNDDFYFSSSLTSIIFIYTSVVEFEFIRLSLMFSFLLIISGYPP